MSNHGPEYVQLASGLIVPLHAAPRPLPTAVDLFCGIGGFSLGFLQAGWRVLAGLDNDEGAAITYLVNLAEWGRLQIHCATPEDQDRLERAIEGVWKQHRRKGGLQVVPVAGSSCRRDLPPVEHFFFGDVRKWRGEEMLKLMGLEVGELDCVCGGPPCQGYSYAGKRNVMDPRNSLVFEFGRLVLEMQPAVIAFENVPGIATMVTPEGIPVMDALCLQLERGHYGTFDALKRALTQNTGARAAIRQTRRDGAKRAAEKALQPQLL